MRKFILPILLLAVWACNKKTEASQNTSETISEADRTATQAMQSDLSTARMALNGLLAATTTTMRHHYDSLYHHGDSLFWVHHNNYHHGAYTHDDHNHHWVAYDTTIHHNTHYHHPFPGHTNDSLVVTPSNHVHNNSDGHHPGHSIGDHHTLDSIHHVHNQHHP